MIKIFFKIILLVLLTIIFIPPVFADEKMTLGLKIYKDKAQCGTCHVLKAAESEGQIGPNLDLIKPTIHQIVIAVTNGVGVMPPWEGILTTEEIEAVAYYVFNSTNN